MRLIVKIQLLYLLFFVAANNNFFSKSWLLKCIKMMLFCFNITWNLFEFLCLILGDVYVQVSVKAIYYSCFFPDGSWRKIMDSVMRNSNSFFLNWHKFLSLYRIKGLGKNKLNFTTMSQFLLNLPPINCSKALSMKCFIYVIQLFGGGGKSCEYMISCGISNLFWQKPKNFCNRKNSKFH